MQNSSSTLTNPLVEPGRAELSAIARALVKFVGLYQQMTAHRVSACRFYPSCSSYAQEAIEVHVAWRGCGLALRRLSRCRPLGPHGVDLVPQRKARSTAR